MELRSDAAERGADGLVERLHADAAAHQRYVLKGEVGRGGMGVVLRIFDNDLRRNLAMKVILGRRADDGAGASEIEPGQLVRFLEEAQVTGQLDHPGVVPVHELGVDSEGRVYFTMRLVKGQELTKIIEKVHSGDPDWNLTRALGVLLRVCEAMSYAHDKGVVHRDLKPANVMVGRHGEVYVMDWGLSRVEGRRDSHDVRLKTVQASLSVVRTDRRDARERELDSPLVTMDGAVVGTPFFMPPEQVEGSIDEIGPRSDVYAAGAMLYHLLAGRMPYHRPGSHPSPHTVLARVLEGPPTPLPEIAPQTTPELEAICTRAMGRRPEDRYADMGELAADLRAYLEHRVVRAYRTGPVAELQKWVRRNRMAAAALATAVVLAVGGFGSIYAVEAASNRELADKNVELGVARDAAAREAYDARRARDLAEAKERKALAIQGFLQDLFESADPSQVQQGALTLRDVLKAATQQLEQQLAGQPEVRRDVHLTLQQTCRNLYLWAEAEAHLEAALAIERELQPAGSAVMARCHWGLAEMIVDDNYGGDMTAEEGMEHYEEARRLFAEFVGDDAPELGMIQANIAYLKSRVLTTMPEEFLLGFGMFIGELDIEAVRELLIETMDELEDLWRAGDAEGAYEMIREGVEPVLALPGVRGNVPLGLSRASRWVLGSGRYDVAEPLARECLRLELELSDGEELLRSVRFRQELATLLAERGKAAGAHDLHRENLAIARRVAGDEHDLVFETLDALIVLGTILERPEDVEAHLRLRLKLAEGARGASDPRTSSARRALEAFLSPGR